MSSRLRLVVVIGMIVSTLGFPGVAMAAARCNGLAPTILGTNGSDIIVGTPGDDTICGNGSAVKTRPGDRRGQP